MIVGRCRLCITFKEGVIKLLTYSRFQYARSWIFWSTVHRKKGRKKYSWVSFFLVFGVYQSRIFFGHGPFGWTVFEYFKLITLFNCFLWIILSNDICITIEFTTMLRTYFTTRVFEEFGLIRNTQFQNYHFPRRRKVSAKNMLQDLTELINLK